MSDSDRDNDAPAPSSTSAEIVTSAQASCRALDPLIKWGDEHGWDQSELLQGLPYDESYVRTSRNRMSWSAFTTYMARFEAKIGGPEALDQLEGLMAPTYARMAQFLGLMASPALLYSWLNRWAGPSNFPAIQYSATDIGQSRIQLVLEIPAHLEDCPSFFRITRLMFRTAPAIIGYPLAGVEMELRERRATYTIHLPPSTTLGSRVSRAFRAFFSGASILDELIDHHDRLMESFQELQETHTELERSEENYRALIDESPLANMVLAKDRILYANRAMNEFLRLDAGEKLSGRKIGGFLVQEGGLERFLDRVSAEASRGAEVEFRADDSEIVVGEVKSMPTRWNGENATLLVCQDVTERNRVMSRATELDRMIAVGTLAAGVAHEINNPMAFIHSNLEYIQESLNDLRPKFEESVSDQRLENLENAVRESLAGTSRVRDIVRDLKAFSRAPEEVVERVDLREVARAAMSMAWSEIRHRSRLRTEFSDVEDVMANAGRLGQVVVNLLVNAAQAFASDSPDHNFITLRTYSRDGRSFLVVEDNGIGIPRENQRRIFEPFYTTKPMGEGTGMGLWISKNIVTTLGGSLTVESQAGRGSLFTMSFPNAPPEDEEKPVVEDLATTPVVPGGTATAPAADDSDEREQRFRVMVVDDEPMIGRLIQRILPHEVHAFTDPHEALKHLRDDEEFDVLLCDSSMPGMSGRDFLVRIRHEYPHLLPRFILITGGLTTSWDDDGDAPPILPKPFNMYSLRQIVSQTATKREAAE